MKYKVFYRWRNDKMIKERVTVDFDEKSYHLDGEYWESWDNYGEEMAEEINKLLDKEDKKIKQLEKENEQLKSILFDTVGKLEMKINPNEDTLYAVTLAVDGAMYLKIKEIIHE